MSTSNASQGQKGKLLSADARQKLLAFASLIGLMAFFSFASPELHADREHHGHPAIDGG